MIHFCKTGITFIILTEYLYHRVIMNEKHFDEWRPEFGIWRHCRLWFLGCRDGSTEYCEVSMWSWLILAEVDLASASVWESWQLGLALATECLWWTGEYWGSTLDIKGWVGGKAWMTGVGQMRRGKIQTNGSVLHGRLSSCPRSWIQKLETHLVKTSL